MLIIYSLTAFASAVLLFFVEPMFARMVLPLLGGSPAVWNTALVFYQAVLILGYLYAHAVMRWVPPRRQPLVHFGVLLFTLLWLPIQIPTGWIPPDNRNPVGWLLALFALGVGIPFFAVSTSGPLLQRWFSWLGHRHSSDPYFIYAVSNAGSMLGLLAYPILAEPFLNLSVQSRSWMIGYCTMVILFGLCAFLLLKSKNLVRPDSSSESNDAVFLPASNRGKVSGSPLTAGRRLRWILLAFIPSSLMLSVTTYMTTDIASVPMIWVIPVGIYLLTFIFAFSRNSPIPHALLMKLMPLFLLPLVVALNVRGLDPLLLVIVLHLIVFFVIAMVCHGELAKDRPPVKDLTEFYLLLSVGGLLGGVFNALIAPLVFKGVAEYPLVLALSCFLVRGNTVSRSPLRDRIKDIVLPLLLTAATIFLVFQLRHMVLKSVPLARTLMFGIPAVISFSFSRRPLRFALAVSGILWAGSYYTAGMGRLLHQERSFFGVSRVTIRDDGKFMQYMNGTTLHGSQWLDPERRRDPSTYYCRTGPLGQFFNALGLWSGDLKIGIVGLGIGQITCYAQRGQQWTYYEIDPTVEQIARDTRYFTYLKDCPASLNVVLGDGRLKLLSAPDGFYDVMILDAYSSDSVPVHLLTREALQLYLRKIKSNGKLLFHISNRYLDLEPVLGNLAEDSGLFGLAQTDWSVDPEDKAHGKVPSCYVVISRNALDIAPLGVDPRWKAISTRRDVGIWTDSFSSIFKIIRWDVLTNFDGGPRENG